MITDNCNKTFFATEKDALFFLDKLKRTSSRNKIPTSTYLCTKCLLWHLTSSGESILAIEERVKEKYKSTIKNLEAKNLELKQRIQKLELKMEAFVNPAQLEKFNKRYGNK